MQVSGIAKGTAKGVAKGIAASSSSTPPSNTGQVFFGWMFFFTRAS